MTADDTPIPAAPTPRTSQQKAAIWGRNAIEPDPDRFDVRHAQVAEAALSPDSSSLPGDLGGAS